MCSAPKAQVEGSFRRCLGGAHWRSKHAEQSREDAVAHPQMGAVGIGMDRIAEELDESLQEVRNIARSMCLHGCIVVRDGNCARALQNIF